MDLAGRSWAVEAAAAVTVASLEEGIFTCSSVIKIFSLTESSEDVASFDKYSIEVGSGDGSELVTLSLT